MNSKIDELTKQGEQNADSIHIDISNIQMTLINIRISVAKMHDVPEARALDVIANSIESSLKELDFKVKSSAKRYTEIKLINMED